MSGEAWAPGDLAMRVAPTKQFPLFPLLPGHAVPKQGGIYEVEAVLKHPALEQIGLVLAGCHTSHPAGPAWCAKSFRKIKPHTPDAEDSETIKLLNGTPLPVREPAL